ncbi:MAG: kynureninase [Oceanipulchritudo sp.]
MNASLNPFLEQAQVLDSTDPLNAFKAAFHFPAERLIYLDGNSLGPLPKKTRTCLRACMEEEWGTGLIRSWNAHWYGLPEKMGDLLAPLLGARDGEVIFADSVTVNLFKLLSAALPYQEGRSVVVSDELNFPSDEYVLEGLLEMTGRRHRVLRVPSADGITIDRGAYSAVLDGDTALVLVSHVTFKSGFLHDLKALTEAAHAVGALVLADLSHSVGAVPLKLEEWGVDLAVGCAYKYLNGGPGAPAFLYVRKDLQEALLPGLRGWFGSAEPFAFNLDYSPAAGMRRFLVGTPPVLSLRAVEPGIKLLQEAGMDAVREKSLRLSALLLDFHEAFLAPLGYRLGSPAKASERGSHLSLRHPEAYRINRALIAPLPGQPVVIPDFRAPDNLRLGLAPLFLSFTDVVEAGRCLAEIVASRDFERFANAPDPVT